MKHKIVKLAGQVQHYAWGGYYFIPQLLGIDNHEKKPFAEYWLGAHSSLSGILKFEDSEQNWHVLISSDKMNCLGEEVTEKFGELPYLLKVLDVREMLSIQVHPSKEAAKKGFEKEEAAGVPINAPYRNYKDKNHKPEIMVALSDFWLLHGFKNESQLAETLRSVPEFETLLPIFEAEGYYGLYKAVMQMPQPDADALLMGLVEREISTSHEKSEPGFWISKLYNNSVPQSDIDKGIFSIYFCNIVHLKAGEGIFQAAGVPHAYLEGQNIELMANSDNVLRGGLTPKHIDVTELLTHIKFAETTPLVLKGEVLVSGELSYPVSTEDFALSVVKLENGREYISKSKSAEIFLVTEGEVHCDHLICKKGDAFVVFPEVKYTIRGIEDAVLFKAFVPL